MPDYLSSVELYKQKRMKEKEVKLHANANANAKNILGRIQIKFRSTGNGQSFATLPHELENSLGLSV